MGAFTFLFYPWGIILQVLAIVHFIRRRPDGYWLWVILLLGPLGAIVYFAVEVIPDAGLLKQSFKVFPRRKRIHELEAAVIDNPSAGNYEELGELYSEEGQWARARACYDKSISARTDSLDPFYRRGVAELELGDFAAAVPDLERVISKDPQYDFHRGIGLLANAYAKNGQPEKAEACFEQAVKISTLSETYYNYAVFLASQGKTAEAREWALKVLAKKPAMPGYQRRRERPWFRKVNGLLKRLPA
jgi:pentatricopeptide repeat protein